MLFDAKLSIPPPAVGFVSRARLIETACTARRRVVAVVAPAGYGKSHLLSQWAAAENRRVGWVSLDRFDDDPVALLTLLASAFVRATGADPGIVADMRVHALAALGRAAPHLASVLRTSSRSFVLFVDDLQVLGASASDVLSVVLGGVPPGSQFVAASRSAQPHVPRLRPADDVLEIGPEDLALDAAGAQQIFRAANVDLTTELAQAVTARTEGWPVGLHLAALIAHDTTEPATRIGGTDRYMADYLYRESFATLPEETRRFLRRTAVLDHMCDEVCQVLLEDPATKVRLRDLESSNVFLIPEDRTRAWYRYHPLYRDFLLGELQGEEPQNVPRLHKLAASWYESQNSPAMAIEHLLRTPDYEHCAVLVSSVGLTTYQAGEVATLQRWLAALGDRAVASHPPLGVLSGWIAVISGQPLEAERWRGLVDTMTYEEAPADGTTSFSSGRAMLRAAMCANGPEEMMADAEFALAAEPTWSPWRDFALSLVAEAHLLAGRIENAADYFAQASERAAAVGNYDVRVRTDTQQALILMDRGRWDDAAELIEGALDAIRDHRLSDYASAVLTFAAAARLALHLGDTRGADRELTRAMRARPVCTYAMPTVAVRSRLCLAKAYSSMGDFSTARHLVREVDDILLHRPAMGGFLEQQTALRNLVNASSATGANAPPLTPAELRLLPYLQTHLTVPEIGARLFVSRNTVSTEVGSIYRKLGVSSRSHAVDRAVAIGLLGG